MSQRTVVPGLFLIGLGVVLLLVQTTSIGGEAVVAVIGAAFLVAYFLTRVYGFLVPAGILLGLGMGILWQLQVGGEGGAVLIGLGLGFASIWLIGALMRDRINHWWPLVPGGIMVTIGLLVEAEQTGILEDYGDLWPIILVVIGVVLLLVQLTRPSAPRPEDAPPLDSSTATPTPAPSSPPSENPIAH